MFNIALLLDDNVLLSPIQWLIDPQSRTFILYWVSSLLIALLWASFSWAERKPKLKQWLQKSYWWNQSTKQDYFLVIFNLLLFSIMGITWLIISISVANVAYQLLATSFSPNALTEASPIILFIGFTAALILLEDLSRYALHRLLHWKWFWRIHQLHHSATILTPFSFLRIHPLEKMLYQLRSSSIYGSTTGLFFFLVGEHPQLWLIFGITGASLFFNFLGANLRHSMIAITYGPFEKILISPKQHQLHHSIKYSRTNFGSIFSFWDLLFSSWTSGNKNADLPSKEKSLRDQLLLKPLD